jgi:CHASE2 domain-containing sensor protein
VARGLGAFRRQSGFRLRVALFLGVGLGLTGAALIGYGTNVFGQLENETVDARFSVRGVEKPPPELILVHLDDASYGEIQQNPIPREYHAAVIDRLREDGASLIVYDFQFTEVSEDPVADDTLLSPITVLLRLAIAPATMRSPS